MDGAETKTQPGHCLNLIPLVPSSPILYPHTCSQMSTKIQQITSRSPTTQLNTLSNHCNLIIAPTPTQSPPHLIPNTFGPNSQSILQSLTFACTHSSSCSPTHTPLASIPPQSPHYPELKHGVHFLFGPPSSSEIHQ